MSALHIHEHSSGRVRDVLMKTSTNPVLIGSLILGLASVVLLLHRKTPDRSGIPLVKKQKNEVFPQTMARGSQEYPDSPFQLQSSRGKITILPIKYFRELDTLPESQSSRVGALKSRNQNALDSLSWLESFLKNSPTIFRRTFSREFVFHAVKGELLPSMEASIRTPAEKTSFPLWALCDELSIRIGSRYWFGVSAPKTDDWVSAYRGARKSVISATITSFLLPRFLLPLAWPLLYWFDRKFRCFKNQLKEMARITADQCGDSLFEPTIKDTVPLYHNMVRYLRSDNLEEDLDREIQSQFHATLFFFSTLTENLAQLLIDLAMNPDHVDELREELKSVSSGDLPTLQSLGELNKLDSFLKESQRFNSLIMIRFTRQLTRDVQFSDGVKISKGMEVSFNLDHINANTKLWDEPEKFKPWRFCDLNKSRTGTRPYDFVSTGTDQPNFGIGRHICPARHFVDIMYKLVACYLILNYDLSLDDFEHRPEKVFMAGHLTISRKIQLYIKPRETK